MGNATLRLDGLQKIFVSPDGKGQTLALSGLNLEVSAGEFLAVAGPSGSGKSTLLDIIAGFIRPTAGKALKNGAPIDGPGPDRVVVLQDHAVFPWYTVFDNTAYGLRGQRLSRRVVRDRTYEALSMVGLSESADAYPNTLSGGMRQRVALARALVLRPDVLLLDEPFAALDVATRSRLQDELLNLWGIYGWTVIFVTHNLTEAVYLADRVALLNPPPQGLKEILPIPITRPRGRDDSGIGDMAARLTLSMETATRTTTGNFA